jgi:outer membrane protein OmpA-like peptidoglycan-associated protein
MHGMSTMGEGQSPNFSMGAFSGGHLFAEGTSLGVAHGAQAAQGARSSVAVGLRASLGFGRWFEAEAELLGPAVGAGAMQVAANEADGNSGLVRDTDGEVHAGVGFDYRVVDVMSVCGDARVVRATASSLGPAVGKGQLTGESASLAQDSEAVAVAANARTVSDLLDRAREIKFEGATTKIAEASMPFLEELAAALLREPGVRLEIVSHTADNGDAKKDLTLSRRRAEAVKHALVGKGISTDQLVATGRGSEDPIAPNLTRTGRLRNERVELHRADAR